MAERSAKQLGLSKADLPNSIIEVIATLSKGGFDAYIVGGGVRDTLLGLNPKDFDAVTDAKPHEIKEIFGKRCRIIGRRFQLAHVYSGRDMIEVATFRAPPNGDAHTTSDGMIVRDNVWGDIKQDFARRDFSINAMYYEPIKGVVHDFCHALEDIKSKTIRLLGDAPRRVEEDPVRLLRALRFKAKLGFDFDEALSQQFHDDNWSLLNQVSPHRLYDESQKMFTGGYLVPLLPLLFEYGAIKHLIIYPPKQPTALVKQVAVNTDKRIAVGKSINPAFFYAALLWDNYLYQLAQFKKKGMSFYDAQIKAASKVIDRQRIKTAIPKFAEQFIRDIWLLQPKLANPKVKQIPQLAEHARFRAAFDFLLLREQCDDAANPLSESTNGMGEWWQDYQAMSEKQKRQAIDSFENDMRRVTSKSNRRNGSKTKQAKNNVDTDQTISTKNGQHNSVKEKDSKRTHQGNKQSNSSSSNNGKNSHDAKERNQLQKLSLGAVAGDNLNNKLQPRPLFVIDEEKIARQVPSQLALMKVNNAKSQKNADKVATTSKVTAHAKVANSSRVNDSTTLPNESKADKPATKDVAAAQLGSIPAKRRRRLPTQKMTQAEIQQQMRANESNASSSSNFDTVPDASRAPNASETTDKANDAKAVASHKSIASHADDASKNKKVTKDKSDNRATQAIVTKNTRVPAKRHRRLPSSDISIREKLAP